MEIPVSNVKPGTVAVLVHPDGTEEIVKNSLPTEDGIQLTVDGSATVKIMDNSKGFIDTRDHWAKDAIDFVSARGLVNGMSDTIYAPNNSTTRAQLWTILARQNDADLTGGSIWYEKAQNWAKDKGVSDGADPNGTINRAQMVTMLWRAMGQPAAASPASALLTFPPTATTRRRGGLGHRERHHHRRGQRQVRSRRHLHPRADRRVPDAAVRGKVRSKPLIKFLPGSF